VTPEALEELRRAYLDDESWQRDLSERGRQTIRRLVTHEWFAGSSDPPALRALALLVESIRPRKMLQVGTHIGFSAVFLADLMRRHHPDAQLFTIDPDQRALGVARAFVREARLDGNVTFVEGYSTDTAVAAQLREHAPFPLAYLDSSHTYSGTYRELAIAFEEECWLDDGLLVLHDAARAAERFDPDGEGGVPRALEQWALERGPGYFMLVLEPPYWPSDCGLGLVRRRTTSEVRASAMPRRHRRFGREV